MIPRAVLALARTLRQSSSTRTIQTLSRPRPRLLATSNPRRATHIAPQLTRWKSSKSGVDEKIEEITELYATARDEFEIAMEETEKFSVYAEDDRNAAREELTKVQEAYKAALEDPKHGEEVKRRIGQRIKELEQGVAAMEELAQNQD
ncbi:uncharacterized protein MYCFIDRAFT_25604 [Pseudocercospora fijiensis CIRAD86]|uniref:Uncharacterized protein n=1 Tax=Pseudocercospora fijiensis (strain CIRAD86) TaxID=383855 RepID=N1QCC0_PSEFD|nr:uncharacterized protein MYCFIDRAFT_25604 [Pseudocercospora fijiensis CIRAD86]EME89127.1 hypothetical protein MYCFIDRAFT_25604 [Pseudocercospora fijiensis CIRAD86]